MQLPTKCFRNLWDAQQGKANHSTQVIDVCVVAVESAVRCLQDIVMFWVSYSVCGCCDCKALVCCCNIEPCVMLQLVDSPFAAAACAALAVTGLLHTPAKAVHTGYM